MRPDGLLAVSNMPVASSEKLGDGLVRTHFQTSPKMATYLIYFGLGDWERITTEVDGTTVGVVVPRGEGEKGRYALGQAASLLHFYNGWFGTKYPLPKLDLIAAPGEIQGGSMENWGAIFYSSEHLLFDPKFSTESDRQLVFLVVSHEMAHQWFGDLVTMAWWDNLWLNEGFARWMQTKAADRTASRSGLRTGLQAMAIYDGGKRTDAGAGTHPIVQPVLTAEQADEAFDAITYNKGAAVITMLEAYAGADNFRDGVRRYMKAHAFGNTVDADLWSEVQATSGKPILQIEHEFTTTVGVPLIKIDSQELVVPSSGRVPRPDLHPSGPTLENMTLSEGRFFADSDETETTPSHWTLPVRVSVGTTSPVDFSRSWAAPQTQVSRCPGALRPSSSMTVRRPTGACSIRKLTTTGSGPCNACRLMDSDQSVGPALRRLGAGRSRIRAGGQHAATRRGAAGGRRSDRLAPGREHPRRHRRRLRRRSTSGRVRRLRPSRSGAFNRARWVGRRGRRGAGGFDPAHQLAGRHGPVR